MISCSLLNLLSLSKTASLSSYATRIEASIWKCEIFDGKMVFFIEIIPKSLTHLVFRPNFPKATLPTKWNLMYVNLCQFSINLIYFQIDSHFSRKFLLLPMLLLLIFFSQHSLSVFLEFNSRLYTKCRQRINSSVSTYFLLMFEQLLRNPEGTFEGWKWPKSKFKGFTVKI